VYRVIAAGSRRVQYEPPLVAPRPSDAYYLRWEVEPLLIIGGIGLLVWAARRVFGSLGNITARTEARPSPAPKPKEVYRPSPPKSRRPRIVFDPAKGGTRGSLPTGEALAGLHDAFTGAPLDLRLGLHQCSACKVYYHGESVAVLREENASRCVACGAGSIVALTPGQAKTSRGRDYSPDVVTLANYRVHFDRVVTFEGQVRSIKISRRGMDYAVMFENASWTKGLKLVFFRGAVRSAGGPAFINSLQGHTVRVRGLLTNHHQFGPEIIISERGMILEISP
jgi:hypothetical protein